MKVVLGVVHIILSIALMGAVLLQQRKEGGFSGYFGGGTQADFGGSQWQRLSALTKLTVVLTSLFMLSSFILVMMSK